MILFNTCNLKTSLTVFFARKLLRSSLEVRIYKLPNKQVFYEQHYSKIFPMIKEKLNKRKRKIYLGTKCFA